jgi:NitT/TauT family transport system permease protein
MKRLVVYRFAVIAGAIALIELLCLTGGIDKITMQPPHLIARDLYRLLVSGRMNAAIMKTLTNTILRWCCRDRRRGRAASPPPRFATRSIRLRHHYAVPVFAFTRFHRRVRPGDCRRS